METFDQEVLNKSEGRKIFKAFLDKEFDNPDELLEKFDLLTKLYFDVNAIINISALRTIDDVYIKHYLDSVYPYKYFSGACCDVGCGGGFPSIPLAIVTGLKITGVESVGKKLLLLKKCVSEISLKNLVSDYARSEDLVKLHRSYDTVCARALADTDKALSLCAPLAKSGGKVLLYKTKSDKTASQATLEKCYVTLKEVVEYTLPGTDIERTLQIYEK